MTTQVDTEGHYRDWLLRRITLQLSSQHDKIILKNDYLLSTTAACEISNLIRGLLERGYHKGY